MENISAQDHSTLTYNSPYPIFAMALSTHLIAIGSFLEELNNKINVLTFDNQTNSLKTRPNLSLSHSYPPTKLMFNPTNSPNLLAASVDFIRIWEINEDQENSTISQKSVLDNSNYSEFCSPLTSFDWNPFDPKRIASSSIDTSCTVWDLERAVVETQIIAHDKEVHDIAWGEPSVFASASADGSVRVFDLRDQQHSRIIYKSPTTDDMMLKLAWNKEDLRYIAATLMDSNRVLVLDVRFPVMPVMELSSHRGCVNAIAWAPQSRRHVCSVGDDSQALIWDLPDIVGPSGVEPVMVYRAESEINQVQWSALQPEWIAIAFGSKLQLLKV